jgi:uncharacterized protein YacL
MDNTDLIQFGLLGLIVLLLVVIFKKIPTNNLGHNKGRKLILDTCALIDGRIIDIAKTGFVPDQLIIPKFILAELQLLADGNDTHKRERARFGLDVVRELQDSKYCDVVIEKDMLESVKTTDEKLVVLAKKTGAQLYTTDYNLNKVADIEGVHVLNVNELAQDLRPIILPGEKKIIKIVQKGSGRDQGVGYLDDGTMVVVEGGGKKIGKSLEVEVTRMHQTVAGKMIFATIRSRG